MKISASVNDISTKKGFLALKRHAEAWNSGFNFYITIMLTETAIGWGRSSFIFVFLSQFLVFFRKFASNSWETASFYGVKGRFH